MTRSTLAGLTHHKCAVVQRHHSQAEVEEELAAEVVGVAAA